MLGATAADWQHFDLVLGLGADLLPVVADPNAEPSERSAIKRGSFGKTPSAYSREGDAHGLKDWPTRQYAPGQLQRWMNDRRLSLCVRTGRPGTMVHAFDIDVTDAALADSIKTVLARPMTEGAGYRWRSNSTKTLWPFILDGDKPAKKRIIETAHGRVELLGAGQQFVAAGTHPSGARYAWHPYLPLELPRLTIEQVDTIWTYLQHAYETREMFEAYPAKPLQPYAPTMIDTSVRRAIEPAELLDLSDALKYPPLVAAAASNDVWSEIGYALLSINAIGAWCEFSASAPSYAPGAPEAWWQAHINQPTRTDYRHIYTLARRLGWRSISALSDFPTLPVDPITIAPHEPFTLMPEAAAALSSDPIPAARHRCTDLANANRIHAHFGHKLRVLAGTFYAYTGTHWERDEGEAARCAASLAQIVNVELAATRTELQSLLEHTDDTNRAAHTQMAGAARPHYTRGYTTLNEAPAGRDILQAYESAEALARWAKACEMKPTQDSALQLVRKLLTIESAQLDAHHHLLNCLNGTINLRTSELQPHNAADFITRCAPVEYKPDATCPHFETFLEEILDVERAHFLRRWFGYCVTGETREQKVLLHIGDGANGKGTLFRVIQSAVGSYMHTAAPHLLTAAGDGRHPTEIADLFGRRLVVSHESDDGAALREGFIKQASGEDQLSARFLFKDFFSFTPTFKLQLLTNHKPVVKGADFGIWRRLLLVWYAHKYGTEEQIAKKEATRRADAGLSDKLSSEREGVLAWLARGAREWYAGGLQAPESVLNDSDRYRAEQDRPRQFVAERCILDKTGFSPYSVGYGALYPAYTSWCKDNGYYALSSTRFIGELKRVVPDAQEHETKKVVNGTRRTVRGLVGVQLNVDEDGGGFKIVDSNEDLI